MKNKKRAQAWGIDLFVGTMIFIVGILSFYIYSLNNPYEESAELNSLFYDGKIISQNLFSEGYPKNWTPTNVVVIGILSEKKINETKLEMFYNMSKTDYERTKRIFNTKYEYYFFLSQNMTINSTSVKGIGLEPGTPRDLIEITRLINYKNKAVMAYFQIWN